MRSIRIFLSTLSLRRATILYNTRSWILHHFYPRSPCGERPHPAQRSGQNRDFYPRSPCGERRAFPGRWLEVVEISIHALLAESDAVAMDVIAIPVRFLSTLSLRRATHPKTSGHPHNTISIHALLAESDGPGPARLASCFNFYPRSPCGERPPRGGSCYLDNIISIHALLAESDCILTILICTALKFLSTLSLRRATAHTAKNTSIAGHFYPRSPCGERLTA